MCSQCQRRHPVGDCWGADMANAPSYIRRRGNTPYGSPRAQQPGTEQQQPPTFIPDRQQAAAAFAGVPQLFSLEGMRPASLAYGALPSADLLPPPRPESYADYGRLGSYAPTGQHRAMALELDGRLSDYIVQEVSTAAAAGFDGFDDAASCDSFATAFSSFSAEAVCLEECQGLSAASSCAVVLASVAGNFPTASGGPPSVLAVPAGVGSVEEERFERVFCWVGEHAVLVDSGPAEVCVASTHPRGQLVVPGWSAAGELLSVWSSSWLGMGSMAAFFTLELGGRVTVRALVSLCVLFMYLVRAGHMRWVVAASVIWFALIMSGDIGLNPGQVTLAADPGSRYVGGTMQARCVILTGLGGRKFHTLVL